MKYFAIKYYFCNVDQNKYQRKANILAAIKIERQLSLSSLAKQFGISEHTARRDIKELSDEGLLTSVRGGAIVKSIQPYNISQRNELNIAEKQIIAQKSIDIFKNGQIVFLDGGSTTLSIAGNIPDNLKITVFTNSLPIANILSLHPGCELHFTGGLIDKQSLTSISTQAINTFLNVNADICFLGVCSIELNKGITARNLQEAEVKNVMCRNASRIIAATVASKVNTVEGYNVCDITDVDVLITELDPSDISLNGYSEKGLLVI